jgi:hypothetical protein
LQVFHELCVDRGSVSARKEGKEREMQMTKIGKERGKIEGNREKSAAGLNVNLVMVISIY